MVNCGQSFFYSMKNYCVPSKLCNRMKSVRDLTLFFPKNCALTLYLSSQNCFIFHKRTFSFPLQTLLNILFLIDFLKTILMLLESGFLTFCFLKNHSVVWTSSEINLQSICRVEHFSRYVVFKLSAASGMFCSILKLY